ncbi:aldo/keto reductase [Galdieria sulphuraria]|uniref:Aldo/keto reductase n=1 Tax=Galdieria sulphuraria TaxID=130081 RepID=M2WZC1_GALSU|nr:aldo/keto reductase [Galdieria sulphuraria]EME29425.1 aldo/keto reductase [Galdieria sulphuraria]|eukprot:XP_005705945.1 aldo/keto reductase [Galdieria sulphuraria]
MKYKNLGSSNLNVSEVCLGTMTFGEQNNEEESFGIMDFAVSKGINFFDTAEAYPSPVRPETGGRTEEIIGSWLVNKPRDKIILATKVVGYQPNSHIPGYRKVPQKYRTSTCKTG